MNIRAVLTGKPKSSFIVQGIEQYGKWLKPYVRIEVRYLPLGGGTDREREKIKEKEGKNYLKLLRPDETVVLLHEQGEQYSSVEFAQKLQKWQNIGVKNLSFLLGGPLGFSDELLSREWQKLSLSRMTFTHEMALMLLLEQLYRAYSILDNRTYHY